jgi:hypothetical protein
MRQRFDIINLALLLLLIMIAGCYFIDWQGKPHIYQKSDYVCQAVFRLETPDFSMPVVAGVSVLHNVGSMMIGGPVYQNNILIGAVNRRYEFTVADEYGSSLFKIHKEIKLEKDNISNKVAEKILPGFLNTPGITIYFKVNRVKEGIFFMRDNRPLFYCQYL